MKRLIAILFFVIYAATAFGMTIDFHYCQGKLIKSSILNLSEAPTCCCLEMAKPMSDDCCNDEIKIFKADNHKTVSGIVAMSSIQYALIPPVPHLLITHSSLQTQPSIISYCSVKRNPDRIYLLYRVFRL
jgi:hypothetical protein